MRERMGFAPRAMLAGLLLSAAVWVAGCGSSATVSSNGGAGTRVVGTVEAPAAQVARAGMLESTLARAFVLGSPAEAAGAVNRRRVRNAQVQCTLLGQNGTLAVTTTDGNGTFQLDLSGLPAGSVVMFTVRARGADGQMVRLRACVRVGSGTQTTVAVNEATTVGADAAEAVLAETGDAQAAEDLAKEIEDDQEEDEIEDANEVPDLHDNEGPREHIRQHAHGHLVAHFERKLQALLSPAAGAPVTERQAVKAIMAAQVYARVTLGLPRPVRLSRAQVLALAKLMVANPPATFTVGQLADKLEAAGLSIPVEGTLTKGDTVSGALDKLQARPRLTPLIGTIADDAVPALVALLLAEQANDTTVKFHISTQQQLNLYVNGLVGPPAVPGPGEAGNEGPGGNGGPGGSGSDDD